MKKKLLALLNAKNELRTKLAEQAKTTEDVKELRSINAQIENMNTEIETLNTLISDAEVAERSLENRERHTVLSQENKSAITLNEYRAIAKMLKGTPLTTEERSLVTIGENGAILPEEFVNQLQILRKGFPALKPYCHVISVSSNHGKMPMATLGNNKLSKLVSGQAIPEGEASTEKIDFSVDDYGKIIPVENSLTDDEVVGLIQNVINPEFAEASVLTENDEIIAVIKNNATAITGADTYEDIETAMNGTLPTLKAGLITVTNVSGYCHLKGLKDGNGKSLDLITMVGNVEHFNGKPIVVMDDADLAPSVDGKLIFYVVNPWSLVKFFDRKTYEIATSKEVLFNYNQTAIRVLERFDVVKGDARACSKIEFPKA